MQETWDDLEAHLVDWGLRHFVSDEAYFDWQRRMLSSEEVSALHAGVEKKRHGAIEDETAFYDLSAAPRILPVLYSQRVEYYRVVGPLVAGRLAGAATILDVGCGPGILTTYYARRYPGASVTGIDRSPACIAEAQRKTKALHLENVRFICSDLGVAPHRETYDCVLATHALVQSEQDPGLPSRNWTTFERANDPHAQSAFERRTGLGTRLDRIVAAAAPEGRIIVFEKLRHPARRVPVQRAFAARGLYLAEPPIPVRYAVVEEMTDDGPLFVLARSGADGVTWSELPEPDEGRPFDREKLHPEDAAGDVPLYENHWPSAQQAWERLRDKTVIRQDTAEESDGRQLHVELGTAEGLRYLYCANTFDQRQLVIVEPARAELLHTYYQEIIQGSA